MCVSVHVCVCLLCACACMLMCVYMHLYVSMYVCVHICVSLFVFFCVQEWRKSEEGIWSPGHGISDACLWTTMCALRNAFNLTVISPASNKLILNMCYACLKKISFFLYVYLSVYTYHEVHIKSLNNDIF